jgi:erythromycin esterase
MSELTEAARESALPLERESDLDPLLERTATARLVLIGEASHGTSEFYRWRAELTKRLIGEQGFGFVGVEGDWPDCHHLHRCVVAAPDAPSDPVDVLENFRRWPQWTWANEEVVDFTRWLREFNSARATPVGFHGLDVYSLWESLEAVVDHVRDNEPGHLQAALAACACFEPLGHDPQSYANATRLSPEGCEAEVVRLLAQVRAANQDEGPSGGLDARFVAEQNAATVTGAERYYREMVRGGGRSWNVRDHHMTDTLDRLLQAYGPESKAVVWAHNSHIGDARATDMASAGLVSLGQLARERHGVDSVVLVGFGTFCGSVIASQVWGGPVRRMPVPPTRPGSVEHLMHSALPGDAVFFPCRSPWGDEVLEHRAIGVVHRPRNDHGRNYVRSVLGRRYDAFLHCDRTTALHPLHRVEHDAVKAWETYPVGQ